MSLVNGIERGIATSPECAPFLAKLPVQIGWMANARPPALNPGAQEQPVRLTYRLKSTATLLVLSLALAGCAVGPHFYRPTVPKGATYILKSTTQPVSTSGIAVGGKQKLELGGNLPGQWWELFHSPALSTLVKRALAKNPDLKAAQAALYQAQENLYAGRSSFFPTLQGGLQSQREQINGASLGLPGIHSTFSVVTGTLSATYSPDIWGEFRRQVEALGAKVDYQRFELEATYLALTSKIVITAINIASIRGQISETRQIISTDANELSIVRRQFAIGGASRTDVLLQKTSLAEARAKLLPLLKQLSLLQNQLNALAGRFPNDSLNSNFSIDTLSLPGRLPITLPSKLIEQRPDIRAAEALLHAASAQVGIATANQLPQFTIGASAGETATGFTNLFSAATGIWSIMGGVSQTLFDAGALQDKKRAAIDALLQATAQYRSTVIKSFQNVSDALQAVQLDATALHAQAEAEKSAHQSYSLAKEQYRCGSISYLTLLTSDRTWQRAKLSLIRAQSARLSDTAVLFQALGGGWWHRRDAADTPKKQNSLSLSIGTEFRK